METIKIEIGVKIDLSADVKNFLSSLFTPKCSIPITALTEQAQTEEQSASTQTVTAAASAETVAAPTSASATAAQASNVTIEEVRAALSKKVNEHRDIIKEKLTELGAPSITKMDPSKYEEMLNFLNSL